MAFIKIASQKRLEDLKAGYPVKDPETGEVTILKNGKRKKPVDLSTFGERQSEERQLGLRRRTKEYKGE